MWQHFHDRARRELFHARATDIASCDLISWPRFSFTKSLRVAPIDCRKGEGSISADVLRERCLAVAHLQAGANVLLTAGGWPNVAMVMKSIEAIDIDTADVSPDHWRHCRSRRAAREALRSSTRQRHDAWRLRRRTGP
ncbi:MAG: DUF2840 domain-containing protein [Mesorhizobium sp.]|nr:MAG: DUF2840 domain-containing protein [Mesorhizobium sp.]